MFTFLQFLLSEEKKSDHKVLAFGRVNPVQPGHVKLFDSVRATAKKLGADHEVVLSHSQDPKKNPLSPAQKLEHAKAASPETNITTSSSAHPTLLHHAARAHAQGYKHLTIVAGEDRVKEFHDLLHKYNGAEGRHGHYNFKSIRVVSAGHRDPDAEGVEGMSGSKMRDHAASGRKKEFMSGVPKGVDGEKMYSDVGKGMGVE
jgi:hypothetical protein